MNIVRFRREHLLGLTLQAEQQPFRDVVAKPEYGNALALAGQAYTVLIQDHPVACIGVQELTPYRCEAWALLGDDCGRHLRAITKAVLGWLRQTHYLRVEASVATTFDAGHKWATLLGFQPEGPARRAFMPDGGDAITYILLKGDSSTHARQDQTVER